MQDLSALARGSLAVSSMAGGNMVSSNELAQTAPGSQPVDPLPDREHQGDPAIQVADHPRTVMTTGTAYAPSPAVWKETPDG